MERAIHYILIVMPRTRLPPFTTGSEAKSEALPIGTGGQGTGPVGERVDQIGKMVGQSGDGTYSDDSASGRGERLRLLAEVSPPSDGDRASLGNGSR